MSAVALITGASSGIGRQLAAIHAEQGGDLVIVARRADKLNMVQEELESKYSVQVTVIAQDLAQPAAARQVYEAVQAAGIEVQYLINNAGFGGQGKFQQRPWEEDAAMIQLNVVTLTALCRLFLPDFVARGSGRVLNVSSTASLLPGPLQAVYFATKAYVTSLSNALAEELCGTGVTVTALLPGATETEFARRSGMENTELFRRAASARSVAQAGYDAMLAGKLQVVSGVTFPQRLLMAAIPFAPKKLLLRQVRKMQDVPTA